MAGRRPGHTPYVGSPQSREGDERKEATLDATFEAIHPHGGKKKSPLSIRNFKVADDRSL